MGIRLKGKKIGGGTSFVMKKSPAKPEPAPEPPPKRKPGRPRKTPCE